jgi:hypothetical protein
MVGTKKERIWNDPPIPGDPQPEPVAVSNIPPEAHAFFRVMMMHSDLRRVFYGMSIAISYTAIYILIINLMPEVTPSDIAGVFILGTVMHLVFNILYLSTKYR